MRKKIESWSPDFGPDSSSMVQILNRFDFCLISWSGSSGFSYAKGGGVRCSGFSFRGWATWMDGGFRDLSPGFKVVVKGYAPPFRFRSSSYMTVFGVDGRVTKSMSNTRRFCLTRAVTEVIWRPRGCQAFFRSKGAAALGQVLASQINIYKYIRWSGLAEFSRPIIDPCYCHFKTNLPWRPYIMQMANDRVKELLISRLYFCRT